MNIPAIRQKMCRKRAQLDAVTLAQNAQAIKETICLWEPFKKAQNITSFIAVRGEQNPEQISQCALRDGKNVFLPIVQNHSNILRFGFHGDNNTLILNKFNIPEPEYISPLSLWLLDIVLLPLTAFDDKGWRIGMGGGFYDRTFAFCKYRKNRPLLIGIAHEFQKVATISPKPWDVPLDGVLTEDKFYRFK